MDNTEEKIKNIINDSIAVKRALLDSQIKNIKNAAAKITDALKSGGNIILFGNGGSAADSQHIAAELTGRFRRQRRSLGAVALTENSCALTAIANDYSFDVVFARQIEGLAKKGDVAVGISTSGSSPNVVEGLIQAKRMGLVTIALSGSTGGRIAEIADIAIVVPSKDTARIQESHITIGHILAELAEDAF